MTRTHTANPIQPRPLKQITLKAAVLLAALVLGAPLAHARSTDRQQPMEISAEYSDVLLADDGVMQLRRNVEIVQGTLNIESDAADITMRGGDIARVVLTGSPARMRQIDDAGQPMNARAGRIDYDLSDNHIVLTGDVEIEQPRGKLNGERVVYDLDSGRVNAGTAGGRVRMVIQPGRGDGG